MIFWMYNLKIQVHIEICVKCKQISNKYLHIMGKYFLILQFQHGTRNNLLSMENYHTFNITLVINTCINVYYLLSTY